MRRKGSVLVKLKKRNMVTQGSPVACGLILTCRVLCKGLAGDASGWLLEGVGGGCGGRARAGVITCHVG